VKFPWGGRIGHRTAWNALGTPDDSPSITQPTFGVDVLHPRCFRLIISTQERSLGEIGSVRGWQRKQRVWWGAALAGLPVCWWLQPVAGKAPLPLLLLLLLAVLTMAVPVGRLGTRRVRFGSTVVLFTTLLYGAALGGAISLVSGGIAQRITRDRHDTLFYASVVALTAQCTGFLFHPLGANVAQIWLFLLQILAAAAFFGLLRVLLLWWGESWRKVPLWWVARAEMLVDSVALPAILATMSAQGTWGWLSIALFCGMGAVGLLSARAFTEVHLAQRQIRALRTMHQRLIAHLHPDHLLQDLANELRRLLSFDRLTLWSYSRQEAHLQIVGVHPAQMRDVFPAYLEASGTLGKALDRRKPVVLAHSLAERLPDVREYFRGHVMIVPLCVHDYPWGLLVLERDAQREPFVRADYETIQVLVEHLAILLENLRLYRQTAEMAVRDGLTGLLNHRRLHERLQEELSRALRYHRPLSLLMIDVDYFKRYNDTYGHQRGDELLRQLAEILRRNIRQSDIAGRYGGEEFAVILPETDKQSAVVLAQRLCEVVASTPFPGHPSGVPVRCTVSIGVASCPEDALTVSDLIAAADTALYRAKRFGKNRVVIAP
jgi:diguanylate cyclase (GGDEF)-like protein